MKFNLKKQISSLEDYDEWKHFLADQDQNVILDMIVSQMAKDPSYMKEVYEKLAPVESDVDTISRQFCAQIKAVSEAEHPDMNEILGLCRDIFKDAGRLEKLQDKMHLMVLVVKEVDRAIRSVNDFEINDWLLYESMDIAEENMDMYMDMDFGRLSADEKEELMSWLKAEADSYSPSDGDNRIRNVLES